MLTTTLIKEFSSMTEVLEAMYILMNGFVVIITTQAFGIQFHIITLGD
uniref:Uncharacterized protein n=1 Tax=Podoviridae sp. ct8Lf7 TaxID=2827723 RepID=A0A8S5S0F9_9CAUD|nr:MAG TPA: hypothetical protein [Podoviridae sp. ct8Lf7]